jgi:heme o synthase
MNKAVRLFSLVKFGIIFGNSFAVAAGFALAGGVSSILFIKALSFASLVIACGCVFNNCYDADIDSLMERTKNRVLAKGEMPISVALIFGTTLGIVAFTLGFFTLNLLTVCVASVGLFSYVVLYTILGKRNTIYGVHVGAISGAIPPVIGYCSVLNVIDVQATILFFMLVFWQIPHSFAIEIFRSADYKRANIPTVPEIKGIASTKISILLYIVLFAVCNVLLYRSTNIFHWLLSAIAILWWVRVAIKGFCTNADGIKSWARKVFFISIANMMAVSIGICANLL